MEGLPARADIDVRCRRVTRRRREIESSIRRGDRRRIIREWALNRQDGIFGMDRSVRNREKAGEKISIAGMKAGIKEKSDPKTALKLLILWDEPCRTRTCDPLVKSQLLYQLS